jgi:hypothetical protein
MRRVFAVKNRGDRIEVQSAIVTKETPRFVWVERAEAFHYRTRIPAAEAFLSEKEALEQWLRVNRMWEEDMVGRLAALKSRIRDAENKLGLTHEESTSSSTDTGT